MNRAMLLLLAACASGTAFAQEEGKRDPVKPEPGRPVVIYRSAFEDYRPYREQELVAWREVNEAVARVGGHAGVMKAREQSQRGKR